MLAVPEKPEHAAEAEGAQDAEHARHLRARAVRVAARQRDRVVDVEPGLLGAYPRSRSMSRNFIRNCTVYFQNSALVQPRMGFRKIPTYLPHRNSPGNGKTASASQTLPLLNGKARFVSVPATVPERYLLVRLAHEGRERGAHLTTPTCFFLTNL